MYSYEPKELLSLMGVWGPSVTFLGVAMGLCGIAQGVWMVFPVVSLSPFKKHGTSWELGVVLGLCKENM